ncbi:MAG TPA: hypothetical protein VE954_36820 [Oligoflexus sp.]|uniref:hypothetical protein n=1 Tax=Oligoflexus sp. TaxID=1971216 RepID=UPI002D29C272|nr:hypothetical protein [Oligoflexus sp.]HYX38701.1 hypothetical protein [Oligoflexus sp.]
MAKVKKNKGILISTSMVIKLNQPMGPQDILLPAEPWLSQAHISCGKGNILWSRRNFISEVYSASFVRYPDLDRQLEPKKVSKSTLKLADSLTSTRAYP